MSIETGFCAVPKVSRVWESENIAKDKISLKMKIRCISSRVCWCRLVTSTGRLFDSCDDLNGGLDRVQGLRSRQ